jgi:hypothetical protein
VEGARDRRRAVVGTVVLLCLVAPWVHYLALGVEIPEGTFLLLSRLGASPVAHDPANVAYSFARPPSFALMGWTFSYPLAYLAVGYLSHAVLQALFVWLPFLGASQARPDSSFESRLLAACFVGLVAVPVLHFAHFDDRGLSLLPHDSVGVFSHRTWFWGMSALATGLLVMGRQRAALAATVASCFAHPTAGLLSLTLISLLVGVPAFHRRAFVTLLELGVAFVVGLSPALAKRFLVERPPELAVHVAYGDWYSAMIKDEADDFSFLYQLLYRAPLCVAVIVTTLALGLMYARTVRGGRAHVMLWASALPPLAFVLGAIAELLFVVQRPTPLTALFVALTPGYRLLSYAFFPLLVLTGHLFALAVGLVARWRGIAFSSRRALLTTAGSVVLVLVLFLLGTRSHARPALAYFRWAVTAGRVLGIEQYLVTAQRVGMNDFKTPRIYALAGPPRLYPGERSLFEIRNQDRQQPAAVLDPSLEPITAERFADIVGAIRARVRAGTGIVIPPYLAYFRDALVDYPIFLQEHHDGNVMMGGPELFGLFGQRMVDLMGFDYEGMPSKHSHLNFTAMRNAYLALDQNRLARFSAKHPGYPLLLAEAHQSLPYAVVLRNPAFVLYDLRVPVVPQAR